MGTAIQGGRAFDPKTGFLRAQFNAPLYGHDIPDNDEPEIKVLTPPELFPALHHALTHHERILFDPEGIKAKDYILVNLALDTYCPQKMIPARMINAAGYQARLRLGLNLSDDGHLFRDMEFNMKTILCGGPGETRKEYEAHGNTFPEVFNLMQQKHGEAISSLDISQIDPAKLYVYAIAMTARAQGSFVHYVENHNCYVEYMTCYDHTLHVDHFSSSVLGEDCEAEFEARMIYTANQCAIPMEQRTRIIAESRRELEQDTLLLSTKLRLSPRSKLGRSVSLLTDQLGITEQEAIIDTLKSGIHPDHFMGDRQHQAFKDYDFHGPLVELARTKLLTGSDIVNYYVHQPAPVLAAS